MPTACNQQERQVEEMATFKYGLTRLLSAAAIVLVGVGAFGTQSAMAGISATKHNLGTTGTGSNKFSGTGEICVFCHTPHGSDTSAAVPLWNRTMVAASAYTTYNSLGTSSLDGATAPVGSVSLACLSCHDGTQAMNVMINQPGSGKVVAAFGAGTWTGVGTLSDVNAITTIGQDLKNDHPIGIQYGGGPKSGSVPAAGNAYGSALFNDADFKDTSSDLINNQSVWWVDTGTAGRQKTDIQLYTRNAAAKVTYSADGVTRTETAAALAGAQPYVECASCHDPHTDAQPTFLRISNSGSSVCLACHIK
jgi:predicted CXXCH cytochrome family protein